METIRLSGCIPEAERALGVNKKEAAYQVKDFFKRLADYHYVKKGPVLPKRLCWLGGTTPQISDKAHVIDFGMINAYFDDWSSFSGEDEPGFVCEVQRDQQTVPASAVYLSRDELAAWSAEAGIFDFEFFAVGSKKGIGIPKSELEAFKTRELASISNLSRGLIKIIYEVSKAYADPLPEGTPEASRAEGIRKLANSVGHEKSASSLYETLVDLASLANIEEFPKRQTLAKYIGED